MESIGNSRIGACQPIQLRHRNILAQSILASFFWLLNFGALAAELGIPSITLDPKVPETGANHMDIQVTDGSGAAIKESKIALVISMPAMATMPRMEAKPVIESKEQGRFHVTYDISMQGTWEIALQVDSDGKKKEFSYSITTGIPGINSKNAAASSGSAGDSNVLPIGPDRLQKTGVRFAAAQLRHLQKTVRAVGVIEPDNTTKSDITLRYAGYVEKQFIGRMGDQVKAGAALFSVYSPELVTAQSEFLLAHDNPGAANVLHGAARDRLRNFGLSDQDISRIIAAGAPQKNITIRAPISGTVLAINVSEGSSFGQGQLLYTIGDLSKNYIVARIFQRDIGGITAGMPVTIHAPDGDISSFPGTVDLIYPNVSEGEGTANVRVLASQHIPALRPGNYVDLRFPVDYGERLAVPTEAVLFSGKHQYVFIDRGGGNLEPREVVSGRSADGWSEIKLGISVGDRVVSSGAFLISSEARLRSALPKWHASSDGQKSSP
jgi:membrane fusion protein, copper/silver efflux system